MAKSSALGLGLQRFVECTLCDIVDGYLGARAIVNPPHRGSDGASAASQIEQITVSFDLVIGHGEGREAVRVLNHAEQTGADGNSVSRVRFELPLSLPGPPPPAARPAVPAANPDTIPDAIPDTLEEVATRTADAIDPVRAKVQDPEDLALM